MKLGLATLATFVTLGAAAPAHASTPLPWCGTTSSAVDRLPDTTAAYAVHVAYVRPPGAPDRFAELAPRIVGDVAAFDAWWRREDSTRTPRFDLFPAPGCSSAFGALDISNVLLPRPIGGIDRAFGEIRLQLSSEFGFNEPEKAYLVYFDGPTDQPGDEQVCGQGARSLGSLISGLAIVFLDACDADTGDSLRPVVAVHELVHVFGAVERSAPSSCNSGHVCDSPEDLMNAALNGEDLDTHVLDFARNDYYGHAGAWTDVQDSFFLDRLDGPDRTPPTAPGNVRVSEGVGGAAHIMWRASSDDAGPVEYWLYQSGTLVKRLDETVALTLFAGPTTEFAVRAADAAGRLSPLVVVRFRRGVGMVDASGRLVRDTVPPPAVGRVSIRRAKTTATLTWPQVRDAGGVKSYRVLVGSRTVTVRKPRITVTRTRVTADITIVAVDRAGNVGPERIVARARVR